MLCIVVFSCLSAKVSAAWRGNGVAMSFRVFLELNAYIVYPGQDFAFHVMPHLDVYAVAVQIEVFA